ncbi:hypothetical protein ELZ19_16825 [Brucella abortus]|nr:hypothetical protein ELZ19_16825 [Brucella abortus]
MDASRGVEINLLGGWRRLGFISLCVFGLILGGSFGAILVCGRIVVFLLTGIRFVVGAALIILFIVDACAVIIAGFVLVVVVLGSFVRGALVFIFGSISS